MAQTSTQQVHVVSKLNNTHHAVFLLPPGDTTTLAPSSIRVRVSLISLSSNNLSYARGGTALHWWDTYPVPDNAPPPFNDGREWGIVPAWGYARVVSSTIDSIPLDSLLYGLWPTSSHAVDLQLEPLESSALWFENSPHRSRLMTMYNHYQLHRNYLDHDFMMLRSLFPVFESARLLNHVVFPASSTTTPVHPLGAPQLSWASDVADLSSSVVVSLSASSKTGRAFAWNLARDRDVTTRGPLGLLQLTSTPSTLASFTGDAASPLAIKATAYTEPFSESMSWIDDLRPASVVVLDFGTPLEVLDTFTKTLSDSGIVPATSVTVVQVGREPKVFTDAEEAAFMEQSERLGKVQYNTSGVRDAAIRAIGPGQYIQLLDKAWKRCRGEAGLGDIKVDVLAGIKGPHGLEGAWQKLYESKIPPGEGLVIEMAGSS